MLIVGWKVKRPVGLGLIKRSLNCNALQKSVCVCVRGSVILWICTRSVGVRKALGEIGSFQSRVGSADLSGKKQTWGGLSLVLDGRDNIHGRYPLAAESILGVCPTSGCDVTKEGIVFLSQGVPCSGMPREASSRYCRFSVCCLCVYTSLEHRTLLRCTALCYFNGSGKPHPPLHLGNDNNMCDSLCDL